MFVLLSRIELNFIGLEHALFHQQFELASVLIEGCRQFSNRTMDFAASLQLSMHGRMCGEQHPQ